MDEGRGGTERFGGRKDGMKGMVEEIGQMEGLGDGRSGLEGFGEGRDGLG